MRLQVYLILLIFFSIVNFYFYYSNHKYERKDARLMYSQSILLILSATFGSFGAIFYMLVNKYKIDSKLYWFINLIGLTIQTLLILYFARRYIF